MARPSRILAIVDKPKHEPTALRRALDLQARCDAHLHLAAFAHHPMYDHKDVFETHQRQAIRREIVRQRTEWLQGQIADAGAQAKDVSLEIVWTKDIADWVTARVSEHDHDLVVKSVHHSETLLHTPLDWELMRRCPAPVLLCTAKRWRRKPGVLATLDLRVQDRAHAALNHKVLEAANDFASVYGGELHCAYAMGESELLRELNIAGADELGRTGVAMARARLREAAAPYDVPGERLHVPIGKVGHAVNRLSRRLKVDLLVMGTTARRGISGMLIGNSAEKVLMRVRCDVLALKP